MSKLAAGIEATLTGNVKASRDLKLRYTDIKKSVNDIGNPFIQKQIRLSVKLQCVAWLDESLASSSIINTHEELQKDLKRAMIEEVFGEFRPLIIEMRSAIWDEDTTRIRSLLAELEHRMFTDGI